MAESDACHGKHPLPPPPNCGDGADLAIFKTFAKGGDWNNFYFEKEKVIFLWRKEDLDDFYLLLFK